MLYNCYIIINVNNWRSDKSWINKGVRNFVIGLGGSSTNDVGFGMLEALGGMWDKNNDEIKLDV